MKQRLKRFYQEQVIIQIYKEFNYKNIHQVPKLKKIIINRGLGGILQDKNLLKSSSVELITITSQYSIVTRARKAISTFKIREKIPVGLIVTLRGERIYAFLDRLINLAMPRIRDFQGVNTKGFDGNGNYSIGLIEQLIFPEIQYDKVDNIHGIDLSIVTTSKTDRERFALLKRLGIPFQKN
jgi:large subunit ribosomal protein L5